MAHKLEVLRKHCEDVGRDPNEIIAVGGKWCVVREDAAQARRVLDRIVERHGMTSPPEPFIGGPDEIAEKIAAYSKVGVKGFILAFADPFDTESIERLGTEVLPRVKELTSETPAAVSR